MPWPDLHIWIQPNLPRRIFDFRFCTCVAELQRRLQVASVLILKLLWLTVAPAASALSTAAATAIPTTPAVPASSATPTAMPPATTAAFLLRPSFVHHQRAAQKIFSVQRFDCFHRVGVIRNFGKTESARLIGKTIPQQRECIGLHSDFREHRGDLFFRGFERQITEVQFLHERSP